MARKKTDDLILVYPALILSQTACHRSVPKLKRDHNAQLNLFCYTKLDIHPRAVNTKRDRKKGNMYL